MSPSRKCIPVSLLLAALTLCVLALGCRLTDLKLDVKEVILSDNPLPSSAGPTNIVSGTVDKVVPSGYLNGLE